MGWTDNQVLWCSRIFLSSPFRQTVRPLCTDNWLDCTELILHQDPHKLQQNLRAQSSLHALCLAIMWQLCNGLEIGNCDYLHQPLLKHFIHCPPSTDHWFHSHLGFWDYRKTLKVRKDYLGNAGLWSKIGKIWNWKPNVPNLSVPHWIHQPKCPKW